MLTKQQEKEIVKALIDNGEIDLGFCRLVKKEIKAGVGASHGTRFKRSKHFRLGAYMSKELKDLWK